MSFEIGIRIILNSRPRFDLTPEQAATWKILLSDISPDALITSAIMLAREDKWEPSPSEWRSRALVVEGRGAVGRLTAAEAWDEMRRNRKLYSPYASAEQNLARCKWSSEAVKRAAEAVVWTDMSWESEQLPTIRAQFERYYSSIADKAESISRAEEAVNLLPNLKSLMAKTDARRLT